MMRSICGQGFRYSDFGFRIMGEKNKILFHICCAACLSYVFKVLPKDKYVLTAFFYNPQVHGRTEYNKRLSDVKVFCEKHSIKLMVPEYQIQEFFDPIMPYQDKNSIKYIKDKKRWKNKRCQLCHSLILGKSAQQAKKEKLDMFSTTMLTSPYKDHDEIWNIGLEIEGVKKILFYYKDFRKGYWYGRNYARNHGISTPTYCGCSYSAEEAILE
jgi:predicted adenine nucleotide alpha hydrolase (AANH) superfamily ATPase